ncbi:hypothetical protein HELRODRAFT_182668 [Helobdella robusta]|uniref:THAP-type domain-containing protein n=1 Tax=Helobdella robusta TaxID=6412 RepID=T1FIK0_HELRO|nr:hypothetical protein HELRODRAFT_182668 [Helobdella robusta]ESN90259.1 hypothetical protein HELRODRAFT_182668 [Helobdella robusta]
MPMCSISQCHGSYKDIDVTLHRLPKDDSQRIQWQKNFENHITYFYSKKDIFICSRHFLQECFYKLLSNDQADTLSEIQSPLMVETNSTDKPVPYNVTIINIEPDSVEVKIEDEEIDVDTVEQDEMIDYKVEENPDYMSPEEDHSYFASSFTIEQKIKQMRLMAKNLKKSYRRRLIKYVHLNMAYKVVEKKLRTSKQLNEYLIRSLGCFRNDEFSWADSEDDDEIE